jgi:hypothetical protein
MGSFMVSSLRPLPPALLLAAAAACSHTAEQPTTPDTGPAAAHSAPAPSRADEPPPDASAERPDTLASRFLRDPLPDGAPFEGEIVMNAGTLGADDRPPAKYAFVLKGAKIRWDLVADATSAAPAGYRIYDSKQRKFFTVLHAPFVYVTPVSALLGDKGSSAKFNFWPFALEPHGAVQGVPCDRMQTDDGRYGYDVCVAHGMPPFPMNALGGILGTILPFGEALEARGEFPLDVLVRDLDTKPGAVSGGASKRVSGRRHAALKVQKLTRAHVSDAAFDLPGYKVVESPVLTPAAPMR